MQRQIVWLALIVILASCSVFGGDDGNGDTPTSGDGTAPDTVIQWDRDPDSVIFRAEVLDDDDQFYTRNYIPLCTLYGDNRVVWTVPGAGIESQVLVDRLTDVEVVDFVEDLTFGFDIYSYDQQADLETFGDVEPIVEQFTLNVNEVNHVTDAFGGWDFEYFETIVELCQTLSDTPALFEPTEAWLSAREVEYNADMPSVIWNVERGIDLAELAERGERTWITGTNVRVLWNILQTNPPNVQLEQGGRTFQFALEVPRVMASAPPPPDDDDFVPESTPEAIEGES